MTGSVLRQVCRAIIAQHPIPLQRLDGAVRPASGVRPGAEPDEFALRRHVLNRFRVFFQFRFVRRNLPIGGNCRWIKINGLPVYFISTPSPNFTGRQQFPDLRFDLQHAETFKSIPARYPVAGAVAVRRWWKGTSSLPASGERLIECCGQRWHRRKSYRQFLLNQAFKRV